MVYKFTESKGLTHHNVAGMDPMRAQERFKPSPAQPIKLHKQMAGDPMGSTVGIAPLRSPPPPSVQGRLRPPIGGIAPFRALRIRPQGGRGR